jgi:hypothetical protein
VRWQFYLNVNIEDWGYSSVSEHVLSKYKALSSNSRIKIIIIIIIIIIIKSIFPDDKSDMLCNNLVLEFELILSTSLRSIGVLGFESLYFHDEI